MRNNQQLNELVHGCWTALETRGVAEGCGPGFLWDEADVFIGHPAKYGSYEISRSSGQEGARCILESLLFSNPLSHSPICPLPTLPSDAPSANNCSLGIPTKVNQPSSDNGCGGGAEHDWGEILLASTRWALRGRTLDIREGVARRGRVSTLRTRFRGVQWRASRLGLVWCPASTTAPSRPSGTCLKQKLTPSRPPPNFQFRPPPLPADCFPTSSSR